MPRRRARRIYRKGRESRRYKSGAKEGQIRKMGRVGMEWTRLPKGTPQRPLSGAFGLFAPRSKVVKMKYATEYSLNCTDLLIAAKVFRCNSVYDPEYAVGGHSAYMFDQIMLLYRRYRVLGSKIKIWNLMPTSSSQGQQYSTILRSSNGTAYTSFASGAHILECNMRGNVKLVGSFNDSILKQGGQKSILGHTYSQKKYFPGIQDRELEGTYESNPTQECYWEHVVFPIANTNPPAVVFRAEITFTVLFSELIVQSESGVDSSGLGIGGGPLWQIGGTGGAGVTSVFAAGDGGEYGSTGPTSSPI